MAEQKLENISKDKSDSSQSKAENESKPKQKSVATTAKKTDSASVKTDIEIDVKNDKAETVSSVDLEVNKKEDENASVVAEINKDLSSKNEIKEENIEAESNTIKVDGEVSSAPTKRKKTGWEIATLCISIVLCVIMLPILLVNVVLIFKSAFKPNDIPSIFGYKPLIVLTDSMYPDIKSGDLIFSKIVDPETLKVGDVITFREQGGGIVTHKILSILTDEDDVTYFQTYGINNYARNEDGTPRLNEQGEKIITPDTERVYFNQVEGKYSSRIAGMGSFIYWMQSIWGLIVCIGLPLIAFVVYEFVRRNAEMKAQRATADNATNELEELRKKLAEMEKENNK